MMASVARLGLGALLCVVGAFAADRSFSGRYDAVSSAQDHPDIDLELSLGGIYAGRRTTPHTITSSAASGFLSGPLSGSPDRVLPDQLDGASTSNTVPLKPLESEQPSFAARSQRLAELRSDLSRHFEANPAGLPNDLKRSPKWFTQILPMIKQRALSAFELRQKYHDLISPAVRNKLWPSETYRSWHNGISNTVPWPQRFKQIQTRYLQLREQVALIEGELMRYEESFRP